MAGISLNQFRDELVTAFPDVPAVRALPILRPADEAALIGWIAETWARSDTVRISQPSLGQRLLSTVSYSTFKARVALKEIRDGIRVFTQSILKQTEPVLEPAGGNDSEDTGKVERPGRTHRPDYFGPPMVGEFSVEFSEAIRIASQQQSSAEILASTTDERSLRDSFDGVRKNSYDPAETFETVRAKNEEKTRSALKRRQLHWRDKAILAMTLIQTAIAISTLAEKSINVEIPDTHVHVVIEQQPPVLPIIVMPQGLPSMSIPALVEVEVFNTLSGDNEGVVVRANPVQHSDRLGALPEGTRAYIVEYGPPGAHYTKIRYLDSGGSYQLGWVLTEKLRRVE